MIGMKAATVAGILALGVTTVPASAQNEGILRDYFEGRKVVVLVDMPADEDGINIEVDKGRSIERSDVRKDLSRYGASIHQGDVAEVTLIKKKGKHIEFQLNGGGWQGGRSASLRYTPAPKSERHRNIEEELALIPDPKDKEIPAEEKKLRLRKILEEDLEVLDREHKGVNAERMAQARANQARAQESLNHRIYSAGSRFNLRFDRSVPQQALIPENFMAVLEKYVDFSREAVDAALEKQHQPSGEDIAPDHDSELAEEMIDPAPVDEILRYLRKGLPWEDVLHLLGTPSRDDWYQEGTLDLRKCRFERTSLGIIDGEFVENILVRYSIFSK